MTINRNELLKELAQRAFIWNKRDGGFPQMQVNSKYCPHPERFMDLGRGRMVQTWKGANEGHWSWIVEHQEALDQMREAQPFAKGPKRWAIDAWLQS